MYLGGQIRTDYNTSYEVRRRIALEEAAYRDMKRIFLDRKLSAYRKLQINHACIATTELYGLETFNLTLRNIKRLEVFEYRAIRRILRIVCLEPQPVAKVRKLARGLQRVGYKDASWWFSRATGQISRDFSIESSHDRAGWRNAIQRRCEGRVSSWRVDGRR